MNTKEYEELTMNVTKLQNELSKALAHIHYYSYATRMGLRNTCPELLPKWKESHESLGLKIP